MDGPISAHPLPVDEIGPGAQNSTLESETLTILIRVENNEPVRIYHQFGNHIKIAQKYEKLKKAIYIYIYHMYALLFIKEKTYLAISLLKYPFNVKYFREILNNLKVFKNLRSLRNYQTFNNSVQSILTIK